MQRNRNPEESNATAWLRTAKAQPRGECNSKALSALHGNSKEQQSEEVLRHGVGRTSNAKEKQRTETAKHRKTRRRK